MEYNKVAQHLKKFEMADMEKIRCGNDKLTFLNVDGFNTKCRRIYIILFLHVYISTK
jgi:hypothetical protein